MTRIIGAVLVMLLISFSTVVAQDMKKEEGKKEGMGVPTAKHSAAMGEMKVGTCSPECGFMVRSHNEGEVMEVVKTHAKKQHNMDMSDKDAMAKIKPAGHMERKEMKKEMIKEETKEMK